MAWMLVILLEWWGLYRLLHHGRLPRSVVYGGLFLLLFGCLFLTAGHVPGNEWVARHQIQGAGGLAGHLLGTGLFLPLAGRSAVLAFSGLGYLLALVYAVGMRPRPFCRAMLREWRAWRMNRKEKRLARQTALLAREAARVRGPAWKTPLCPLPDRSERAGLPFPVCSAPGTIWKVCIMKRRRLLRPSRRILSRLPAPRAPRAAFPGSAPQDYRCGTGGNEARA